jgi:hypothetical protein
MQLSKEGPPIVPVLPERLEQLLAFYESNLQLELFFIGRREIDKLLEMLPTQASLIQALTECLTTLKLPPTESEALRKRLEAADDLRESNRKALDQAMAEVKEELQEMALARQRIRQARQLSNTMYQQSNNPSQLQDWA